jgi:hypothetical protein
MTNYIAWIERNDWEGETWVRFVQDTPNNQKVMKILQKALDEGEGFDPDAFSIEYDYTAEEVDVLVRRANAFNFSTYMQAFETIDGELDLKAIKKLAKTPELLCDALYKGKIEHLVKSASPDPK